MSTIAYVERDLRISLFGKPGGFRVVILSPSEGDDGVRVCQWDRAPVIRFPVTDTDAARLRRGTICNPRKLLAHYFEERRNG